MSDNPDKPHIVDSRDFDGETYRRPVSLDDKSFLSFIKNLPPDVLRKKINSPAWTKLSKQIDEAAARIALEEEESK